MRKLLWSVVDLFNLYVDTALLQMIANSNSEYRDVECKFVDAYPYVFHTLDAFY